MNTSRILLVVALLLISACSGGEDKTAKEKPADDHVWKAQTDALEKAKQTEQMIMDAAEQQKRKIEEQSQ